MAEDEDERARTPPRDGEAQGAGPGAPTLDDGTYDVFVIDASIEGDGPNRIAHLDLTVTVGEHKGEVLSLAAAGLRGEEFDLIGMPATLTVSGGSPSIVIDS